MERNATVVGAWRRLGDRTRYSAHRWLYGDGWCLRANNVSPPVYQATINSEFTVRTCINLYTQEGVALLGGNTLTRYLRY